MPGPLKRLIPSMFARRLLLLSAMAVALFLALAGKLAWITLAEADIRREAAESVLVATLPTPTLRGRILDCKDRILAAEKASYDVAVHYSVITGDWAHSRASSEALAANRARWKELSFSEQEQLIGACQDRYDKELALFWDDLAKFTGVDPNAIAERKATVIQKVEQVSVYLWYEWQKLEQLRLDGGEVPLNRVAKATGEQNALHEVVEDVDAHARVRILQMAAEAPSNSVWKRVQIVDSRKRVYPHEVMEVTLDRSTFPLALRNAAPIVIRLEGVAMHTLGSLRTVWKEDYDRAKIRRYVQKDSEGRTKIDLWGYRPGDLIGSFGVEASQEQQLRGTRGKRVVDRSGKTIEEVRPLPGRDVSLSLDISLQTRVESIMSHDERVGLMRRQPWDQKVVPAEEIGKPINGAAVVMDVALGHVLAAVSVPGISRRLMAEKGEQWGKDEINLPLWHRPVAMSYQPGSTVKPLILACALTDGKVGYDEQIECTGYFRENKPNDMRCWIYNFFGKTHGLLSGTHAIEQSCNIFFYTMGQRFGSRRLVTWFDRLGLGKVTRCGIIGEASGMLPNLELAGSPNTPGFAPNDAIFMAIGQGPIRWTPLQAAGAYATLARNGTVVHPTFLVHAQQPSTQVQDWHLDPRAVDLALEGMRLAVSNEQDGTVNHLSWEHESGVVERQQIFSLKGDDVTIMAKSGTADTGKTTINGVTAARGDHAWTICLAQRRSSPRPDFVIVVIAEYAGSGARVSGPIVNQILLAMRKEGYL